MSWWQQYIQRQLMAAASAHGLDASKWPWIERVTDGGMPVAAKRQHVDYLNNSLRKASCAS